MSDNKSNNKKIAVNTFILYFRMVFLMAVGLYTSRVILRTLGAENYGIYNVVGGVVTMFVFINYAMMNATQRYVSFELGKNDEYKLNKVFCTSLNIHFFIGLIVLLLVETIGIWFLNNKLVIPAERMNAAFWVLQFSAISTFISIVSVPYNALIVAYEKMSAFAYITMFDGVCKLLIAFIICYSSYDRLIVYAFLLMILCGIDTSIYIWYCRRYLKVSKYHFYFDKSLSKEMASFAGWSITGNLAYVCATQGINILLNLFFNPVVNAARGLAVQVQSLLTSFSSNIETAIKPQITKSYAIDDYERVRVLSFASARFSFYALLVISLPLIIEIDFLLNLWLETVPPHTGHFIVLIVIISLLDSLSNPMLTIIQASGQVRKYQLLVGLVYLSLLPLSYIALNLVLIPEIVFFVNLAIVLVLQLVKLLIVCPCAGISVSEYLKKIYVTAFIVSALAFSVSYLPHVLMDEDWCRLIVVTVTSVFFTSSFIFFLGLEKYERLKIRDRIIQMVKSKFIA